MPTERNPHIEIDEFFDQWRLYDAVIRHNYMTHREIHAAIHGQLAKFDVSAGTLLDLGCGDASQIARSVDTLTLLTRSQGASTRLTLRRSRARPWGLPPTQTQ